MKKIIAIAFLLSLVAAPAFAYTDEVTIGSPSETICVLSKNVVLDGVSSATRFAATTAHNSGSKQFGVTSESTSIYTTNFELGVTAQVVPTVSDTTSFSGWTTL